MTPDGPVVLVATAPAKINLGLAITGVRPDGYHDLASVFLRLGLSDTLAVTVAGPGRPDALTVDDPDCPVEGNLVLRALAALRSALGDPDRAALPGLLVALSKRIPMGGGLAGGSTDAAATLRLASAAWGLVPELPAMQTLAGHLGADVPFFTAGHAAALVTGIGDEMAPLPGLRSPVGVLLAVPPFGLATPAVFRAWDRAPTSGSTAADAVTGLVAAWAAGMDGPDLAAWAPALRDANDLWAPAASLEPRLATIRAALAERLGTPVLLTGSGSTLVALYPSPGAAREAAAGIAAEGDLAGVRLLATADEPSPHEDPAP